MARRANGTRWLPAAGDLWGGLAACAVLLPQSMAFGVALYAIVGGDAAAGAYAGLAGTAALCIGAGLFGGTRGLISAPSGPVLVLLGGACASLAATGLEHARILQTLAVIMGLAGVMQFALGVMGGGRLIKYMPFPVVSGFMTGSGILMIISQLEPLSGPAAAEPWQSWRWLPAAAAATTIVAAWLAPRFSSRLPAPVFGLIAGTIAFHLLVLWHGGNAPQAWMIGQLPALRLDAIGIAQDALNGVPWAIVLPAAAALALLASLDTLLTSVVADVATGTRHDSRVELMGQGVGQLGSALLGGMAGAGTTAATVIAIKSGGGRWVAVAAGIAFLFLTAFAGDIGRWLPIGALAGVIILVAFAVMDRDVLRWARDRGARMDALIAVLVTTITVFYDLMVAVGAGVVIAAVLFIHAQVRAPVVQRRTTAREVRSRHTRVAASRELLDAHGERIVCFDLRGSLFFGTADRLIDELGDDIEGANWVILNMQRVQRIDLTAIKLIVQIAARLGDNGGTLILCDMHSGAGLGREPASTIRRLGGAETAPIVTVNGRDEALEFAEDALLNEIGAAGTHLSSLSTVGDNEIARYMTPVQQKRFESLLSLRRYSGGEKLFARGEAGEALYLVLSGKVQVLVPTTQHHHMRLAIYGAGTFFGELALLKSGARAADALASSACDVAILSRDAFDAIKGEQPELAIAVLSAISERLVSNQRWSTQELRRLSDW